ncbi:hypothetical protein QBC37DRAFT_478177 [Rhypophila decipiens]|uniref:Uncharacterized protein n=1 Tax=Rhypophila decipiens TaxID=261697 RepID=A0AAN7BCY8_9PEZI|nr:hypothetical protein QBC37DRAFT_478177 [Rhypophila decipiens]
MYGYLGEELFRGCHACRVEVIPAPSANVGSSISFGWIIFTDGEWDLNVLPHPVWIVMRQAGRSMLVRHRRQLENLVLEKGWVYLDLPIENTIKARNVVLFRVSRHQGSGWWFSDIFAKVRAMDTVRLLWVSNLQISRKRKDKGKHHCLLAVGLLTPYKFSVRRLMSGQVRAKPRGRYFMRQDGIVKAWGNVIVHAFPKLAQQDLVKLSSPLWIDLIKTDTQERLLLEAQLTEPKSRQMLRPSFHGGLNECLLWVLGSYSLWRIVPKQGPGWTGVAILDIAAQQQNLGTDCEPPAPGGRTDQDRGGPESARLGGVRKVVIIRVGELVQKSQTMRMERELYDHG